MDFTVQYKHLFPIPVDWTSGSAWLYKHPYTTDGVLDIVYKHSCKWRYDLNTNKSATLVYGEDVYESRLFLLGPKRIKERSEYDHVGIKACIFPYDDCVIENRLKKTRRAFHASMGLGIRKNGLTVATCSVIFWMVIIPYPLLIFKNYSSVTPVAKFKGYMAVLQPNVALLVLGGCTLKGSFR